jgi:hypothetical protein
MAAVVPQSSGKPFLALPLLSTPTFPMRLKQENQ